MFDALRQVPLFAGMSDDQLRLISEQGTEVWLNPGEVLITQGELAKHFYVVLEGELQVTRKMNAREAVITNGTWQTGTFFAEVPLLQGVPYVASVRALSKSHVFRLGEDAFWQMLATYPSIMKTILHSTLQCMRHFQSVSLQDEKLIALGTLAAGLAHELNNPAAAGRQGARYLHEIFQSLSSLTLKLNQQMTKAQLAFLADLQRDATERATTSSWLDSLTQSDRENSVTAWLEAHDVADGWKLAPILVDARLDTQWLDTVLMKVPADSLGDVLSWISAMLTGVEVLDKIEISTARISEIVKAIKDYSYMDRSPLQQVDVHEGLESTLTILGHKLKGGVVVTREYDCSLACISAYGSELNQVWTNLIDNAIDAMGGRGQIWVRTYREQDHVLVEIADSGPGIPPDILCRIFEPFFTTKGVGEGTGLGLDISYRIIVGMHHGDIRVFSQPGVTRFQVRLPINPS